MEEVLGHVKPGVTTMQLDRIVEQYLGDGGDPSFKGYNGFSRQYLHVGQRRRRSRIPSDRKVLRDGDILSIDMGAILNGWQSDMARTVAGRRHYLHGAAPDRRNAGKLFSAGMREARAGNRLKDISRAIEEVILRNDMGIVRSLWAMALAGRCTKPGNSEFFLPRAESRRLDVGMVLAIEPMVTLGGDAVCWMDDGWLVKTADGSLAAHYENTVAITENGPEILTAP